MQGYAGNQFGKEMYLEYTEYDQRAVVHFAPGARLTVRREANIT
jgi:hypothetical protein